MKPLASQLLVTEEKKDGVDMVMANCQRAQDSELLLQYVEMMRDLMNSQGKMGARSGQGDAIYVAVGRDVEENKANLSYSLRVFKGEKIVILHIQQLPQNRVDVIFQSALLTHEMIHDFIEQDWKEIMKRMKEYQEICRAQSRKVDQLVRKCDADEVLTGQLEIGKALIELIAQHGIQRLVMGAGADSMQMNSVTSCATYVNTEAPPSCQIWFICKGRLIYTRPAHANQKEPLLLVQSPSPKPISRKTGLKGLITNVVRATTRSPSFVEQATVKNSSSMGRHSLSGSETSTTDRSSQGIPYGEQEIVQQASSMGWNSLSEGETSLSGSSRGISFPEQANVQHMDQHSLSGGQTSVSVPPSQAGYSTEPDWEYQISEQATDTNGFDLPHTEIELSEKEEAKDIEELFYKLKKIEDAHRQAQQETLETFQQKQRKYLERKLELLRVVRQQETIIKDQQARIVKMEGQLSQMAEKSQELERQITDHESALSRGLPTFTEFFPAEVAEATNDFHPSNIIGKGGFGRVYKGFIRCTEVAIKTLSTDSNQGIKEFNQEINVLSKVRHPNLVTLIGASTNPNALIYEYLPNGSLEDRLRRKEETTPLTWQARTRIAAEICSALLFLHSFGIIHGDLKPANVLLDMNLTAKIGDFGICRVLPDVISSATTSMGIETDPKGTFSYIDPEFVATGTLTAKSDIFAFGIIILQLITGWPPLWISREVMKFENDLQAMVDPTVRGWPFNQVMQLKELGLKCCHRERKCRPSCKEIWECLKPMRDSIYLQVKMRNV